MATDVLSEEQAREVGEAVASIAAGSGLSLFGLVESLRDQITSKSTKEREQGFSKLVGVVMTLPIGSISSDEASYLLNFLLPRVEDSGHVADSLMSGIHHLLRRSDASLSNELISHAATVLFEGNNVQAYASSDRLLLFDLMEHFLDARLDALRALGPQQFVLLFVRAANSERDPRCLLRIFRCDGMNLHRIPTNPFRIFLKVVDHFTLGVLTEDMFELVACYFPIEYEPSETDVGRVDKKMLVAGCEACLLAHSSFSTYCFQLVAEKLMEEPAKAEGEKLETQLAVCAFLGRTCRAFMLRSTYGAVRQNMDDYLASLRLIFFNPVQTTSTLDRTAVTTSDMLKALAANMEECSDSVQEDFKLMATNMLENCEPFVLQSEMGLTEKALRLLALIADCNQLTFELIVPKALYWLNLLLQGSTIKSPENKKEIGEETLELLPEWVRRGAYLIRVKGDDAGMVDRLQKPMCDLLPSMDALHAFCDTEKVLKAKFTVSKFLCTTGQPLPAIDQLYEEVTSSALLNTDAAKQAAEDFVIAYARLNPQKCLEYLRSLPEETSSMPSERANTLLAVLPSFATLQSLEPTASVMQLLLKLANESVSPQLCSAIERVLKICPPTAIDGCVEALKPLYETILTGELSEETSGCVGAHLLNIARTLRQRRHSQLDVFAEWLLSVVKGGSNSTIDEKLVSAISPFFQQLESKQLTLSFWDLLIEQFCSAGSQVPSAVPNTLLSLHFSIVNRHNISGSEMNEKRRSSLVRVMGSQLPLAICEANAQLMSSTEGGEALIEQLFNEYCSQPGDDESAVMEYSQQLSASLLKFDDPEKFGYVTTSPLWRQRVVRQTVSLYLDYYSRMPDGPKKKRFLCLIPNILQLSKGIHDPLGAKIMPVMIEALPLVVKDAKELRSAGLLLGSVKELLGNGSAEWAELSPSSARALIESVLAILKSQSADVSLIVTALDCLLTLASISPKGSQLKTFLPRVIQSLMITSRSNKRIVRHKSAAARNAWELMRE